jgi:hypothetical protein
MNTNSDLGRKMPIPDLFHRPLTTFVQDAKNAEKARRTSDWNYEKAEFQPHSSTFGAKNLPSGRGFAGMVAVSHSGKGLPSASFAP